MQNIAIGCILIPFFFPLNIINFAIICQNISGGPLLHSMSADIVMANPNAIDSLIIKNKFFCIAENWLYSFQHIKHYQMRSRTYAEHCRPLCHNKKHYPECTTKRYVYIAPLVSSYLKQKQNTEEVIVLNICDNSRREAMAAFRLFT